MTRSIFNDRAFKSPKREARTEVYGTIHATGLKAVLFFDGTREVWLPKSQIEIGDPDKHGNVTIDLPEWLAKEKELI